MMRLRLILVGCFALTFAAGGAAGYLLARHAFRPSPPPAARSPLAVWLDLTARQEQQLADISSSVFPGRGGPGRDWRGSLTRERDEEIRFLLTEDQIALYDLIMEEYRDAREERWAGRQKAFEEARRKSLALLTPEQIARCREIPVAALMLLRPAPHREGSTRPTTQPAPHREESGGTETRP